MKTGLSEDEKNAFFHLSFAMRDNDWNREDEIKGVTLPKKDIPLWLEHLREKGYYFCRENDGWKEYKMTPSGLELFDSLRKKAEKAAMPVPLRYPRSFKANKSSYY